MSGVNNLSSNVANSYAEALGDLQRSSRERARLAGSIAVASAKQAASLEQSAIEREQTMGRVSAGLGAAKAAYGAAKVPKEVETKLEGRRADEAWAKAGHEGKRPPTAAERAAARENAAMKAGDVAQQQTEQGVQGGAQDDRRIARALKEDAGFYLAAQSTGFADAREDEANARDLGQNLSG